MQTINRVAALLVVLLTAGASPAFAQRPLRPLAQSPDVPPLEIGASIGLWSLDQFGSTGVEGRVSVNRSEWLGAEISYGGRSADANVRAQRILVANARVLAPLPGRSAFVFATAGGAVGHGLDRRAAPMVGFGVQSFWQAGVLSGRVEIQHFPGPAIHYGMRGRILMSAAIAIR